MFICSCDDVTHTAYARVLVQTEHSNTFTHKIEDECRISRMMVVLARSPVTNKSQPVENMQMLSSDPNTLLYSISYRLCRLFL